MAAICCNVVSCTRGLLVGPAMLAGRASAVELPDRGRARQMDRRSPLIHIPLPEEKAFKGFRIPPKRERLSDELTVEVRQFVVGRRVPRRQPADGCATVRSGDFCPIRAAMDLAGPQSIPVVVVNGASIPRGSGSPGFNGYRAIPHPTS